MNGPTAPYMQAAHRIVVGIHKAAEEKHLDGRLKAKHGLLGDLGRRAARLGASIARLQAAARRHRWLADRGRYVASSCSHRQPALQAATDA